MSVNVEDLIAHPQRFFGNPWEVLEDARLSSKDKRKVLESWKHDATRMAESTAENMSGGEEENLREVSKVLLELKSGPMSVVALPKTSSVAAGVGIGALVGAGAGLVAIAVAGPSLVLVIQTTVVGLIVGGVVAGVRDGVRDKAA